MREDRKVTTIRESAWPVGKPVMLYHWSGKPYRSKQVDVCVVRVIAVHSINITRWADGSMGFYCPSFIREPLWYVEGFGTKGEMDEWFAAKMKPGTLVWRALMHFERRDDLA